MENENLIAMPTIKIGEKIIKPQQPRMKAWRKFLEFNDLSEDELKAMSLIEYTDTLTELIILSFNRPELTAEILEENLSIADFKPLTSEIFRWLQKVFFTGLEEIPNAEEAAEN